MLAVDDLILDRVGDVVGGADPVDLLGEDRCDARRRGHVGRQLVGPAQEWDDAVRKTAGVRGGTACACVEEEVSGGALREGTQASVPKTYAAGH